MQYNEINAMTDAVNRQTAYISVWRSSSLKQKNKENNDKNGYEV